MFRLVVTVLCTTDEETSDEAIAEIKMNYNSVSMEKDEDFEKVEEPKEEKEANKKIKKTKKEALYAKSRFYKLFFLELNEVRKKIPIDEKNITNKFYDSGYADYITEKYMPYAPVLSAIILSVMQKCLNKASNAPVEGYFLRIKKDVLKRNEHNSPRNFCEMMKRDKEVLSRKIETRGNNTFYIYNI